jgi:AcrR family transcriptional regulator
MAAPQHASPADAIIAVVLDLLERQGEEAVRVREVARQARLSLRTIYEHFADRDELVLAAVQRWMAEHTYAELEPPATGDSLHDGLMRILRGMFEPWERSPHMLVAFYRAHSRAGGKQRLDLQTFSAVAPISGEIMAGVDRRYAEDIALVLGNMSWALVGRFARGEVAVTDILPTLERAVYRLTADNTAEQP